jgi:hypothetical protein
MTELREIRRRSCRAKGDLFETFAKLYFETIYGMDRVWAIKDLPDEVASLLSLSTHDMGIDLVGSKGGQWYAVQVKYRSRPSGRYQKSQRVTLPWKDLATFYGLVARCGPFAKHVVFTSADSVRRTGKKTGKDETIGHTALKNLTRNQWKQIMGNELSVLRGETLVREPPLLKDEGRFWDSSTSNHPSPESLRAKRLAFFQK